MSDPLKNLFDEQHVDWASPEEGHLERFEKRLEAWETTHPKKKRLPYPLLLVASIALLLGLFGSRWVQPGMELQDVSMEMQETQDYFSMMIVEQTEALEVYKNEEERQIIDNVLKELQQLENEYDSLKLELEQSAGDMRVVHAMVNNFRHRTLLLEDLLKKLKENQELKLQEDEHLSA